MFTGIIQQKGKVRSVNKTEGYASIEVLTSQDFLTSVTLGDSISVNGVCLTVIKKNVDVFSADIMNETLEKSNLSIVRVGDTVNLEKATTPDSFLGGHIVQGHVDSKATVKEIKTLNKQWIFEFSVNSAILNALFPKASISINGVSLTILNVTKESFSVSIIPTTFNDTNFFVMKKGDTVNIETDIIGKYVFRYLENSKEKTTLTKGFLSEHGF